MGRDLTVWPVYFATKALKTKRGWSVRKGQPFPFQDKAFIRGLARAYGVADADAVPFGKLPYVEAVTVRTEEFARMLVEKNVTVDEARRLAQSPGA